MQRVVDVGANVQGRDLGAVAADIQRRIDGSASCRQGMKITVRGQSQEHDDSFRSLGLGLILAIVLVYCLMVILFQSWLDPFIIMVAVPGALVGILWMLALTGTTLNVESLMGAIMAVGHRGVELASCWSASPTICASSKRSSAPLEAALEAGKHAPAAGAHDGAGDDPRHAADGAGPAARAASRTRRSGARSSAACWWRRFVTLLRGPGGLYAAAHEAADAST